MSAACFANQKYEDSAGLRCISNLLGAGFRRIEADIFWDASRSHWSLCPVELGSPSQALTTSTSLLPAATAIQLASRSPNKRQNDQLTTESATTSLSSVSVAEASRTLTVGADATPTALDSTGTSTAYTDGSAMQIGNLTCTSTMDLDLLLTVLSARLTDVSIQTMISFYCDFAILVIANTRA